MGVDAGRRSKHGSFGIKTDDPETSHATALSAGFCQGVEKGMDRGGAAAECPCVHVRMATRVDMADKSGLGPSFQLAQKTTNGNAGDNLCSANVSKSRLGKMILLQAQRVGLRHF
jgi:hypothetical protein